MCRVFFFNDTATTEIYTLSLHDALPISQTGPPRTDPGADVPQPVPPGIEAAPLPAQRRLRVQAPSGQVRGSDGGDRKSTRLNSSHANISYAVFCLKKKKNNDNIIVSILH